MHELHIIIKIGSRFFVFNFTNTTIDISVFTYKLYVDAIFNNRNGKLQSTLFGSTLKVSFNKF